MKYFLLLLMATILACSSNGTRPGDDGGADSDSDTDTDADTDADSDADTDSDIVCSSGKYNGNFEINLQSDVSALAGYTSISGNLVINCPDCTDLSGLTCLATVFGDFLIYDNDSLAVLELDNLSTVDSDFGIYNNDSLAVLGLDNLSLVGIHLRIENCPALTNLNRLSSLTYVEHNLIIRSNYALPDCEVCDLLDQLTNSPDDIDVHDNLDDTCTPVPAGCP